jgi:hypothetical protein
VVSAEGEGPQAVTWDLESGEWTGVIMNGDGSAGVSVEFNAGARVGILLPIAIGLVVGGILLGVLAIVLLVLAIRRPREAVAVQSPAPAQGGTMEPTTPMDQGPADRET